MSTNGVRLQDGEVGFLPADCDVTPTLSVVLPTKDEAAGIADCLEAIRDAIGGLGLTAEVIVSDSSTDDTPAIATDHGAIVVEPDRDGYGYAYRYAFERARGEYIVMGDADTTYDFRELLELYERLVETDADLVIGSRFAGDIRDGAMPTLHRHVGNPVLTWFLNRFYDADVSDAHSGFRLIRRDALEALSLGTDGMEFASEMIMAASTRGLAIEEVPITYHEREGETTLSTFRDGWQHVRFMLLNAPGYLFSLPGVGLAALGSLVMVLAIFNVEMTGLVGQEARFGTRSMVAGGLLTIVGYQIVGLGIFATVASEPIRRPSDRLVQWIVDNLSLERGLVLGAGLFAVGTLYASGLVALWLTAGYDALPRLTHDVLAFTIIVLGMQTIFGSFFMSVIRPEPVERVR